MITGACQRQQALQKESISWIHFSEYLPKFKKIIPNDYKRMLNAIVQMEEKGLSSEQAQIEAFYANAGRK